ncbi:HAT, C-terminal dimerization domain containing protein [Heracleum sosnowskyi]|uniref:HAT, C-terminal dimerization domain containing protein n=1 Tax=Heracleum sosnowskyi TaxID=360622 RepID=A0AAD8H810_9APIA|nr:HAT, C-terminal dimerization domain containing protein [Heracleum sosnowskyi]
MQFLVLVMCFFNIEDEAFRKMASHMKLKYDKYWGDIDKLNHFIFISVILDPRRKMVYVDWMVKIWFGAERCGILYLNIKSTFCSLFDLYGSSLPHSENVKESSYPSSTTSIRSKEKDGKKMFDFSELVGNTFEMQVGGGISEKKVEWEKYLEDERESNESFPSVLQWWKDNNKKYPTLAKIAQDILAIPVSTVASESAFSTRGRVLDSFRTSLTPRMVEALICAQDWLRNSYNPLFIKESLLEMEKFEEGTENLTVEQPMIIIDEQ